MGKFPTPKHSIMHPLILSFLKMLSKNYLGNIGVILTVAIWASIFLLTENFLPFCGIESKRSFRNVKFIPDFPRQGKLGVPKAYREKLSIFFDLFPLKSLSLKKMQTSGMQKWPAIMRDPIRLSKASFLISLKGICDPVIITVFARFSSMKLNAEAL